MTEPPKPSKVSLTNHPSQDSGIGTSLHDRSDYDLAMSLALDNSGAGSSSTPKTTANNSTTITHPTPHRPDIPLPTSFPRTADHPAQRNIALANGRRTATAFTFNSDVAHTIRLVDTYSGESSGIASSGQTQNTFERRIRARYALPAVEEVAEGVSPRLSHASAGKSIAASASQGDSATVSHRSSGITEDEDYSFISFEGAEAEPLMLQVPASIKARKSTSSSIVNNNQEERKSEDERSEALPSPNFPPENGSSRFRERFSLDGPEVFRASAESVVGEADGERAKEGETVGGKEKEKVCGSVKVARVWKRVSRVFGKDL